MAVVFSDQFTEASDTALTSHTPAPTGTNWTQVVITGTPVCQVYGADDAVGGSAAVASNGHVCKIAPAPSQFDIDIAYTISVRDPGSATRPIGVMAHMSDDTPTNYYRIRHLPTGHTASDTELMEMAGGTKTSLGTIDTGIVDGDDFVLVIRNGSQELFKNGSSILSASDASISSPGGCGIAIGFVKAGDTGNIATVWRLDDFILTEVSAASIVRQMLMHHGS